MSNLRLINETTVTSGVTTVNITDVFSADYDIYKVVVDSLTANANAYYYTRFINSSGTAITSSISDNAALLMRADNSFVEYKGTNTKSVTITSGLVTSTVGGNNGVFYFFNPYSSSYRSFMLGQESLIYSSNNRNLKHIGMIDSTASMGGISFFNASSGTFTAGTIRTYGLRVDT